MVGDGFGLRLKVSSPIPPHRNQSGHRGIRGTAVARRTGACDQAGDLPKRQEMGSERTCLSIVVSLPRPAALRHGRRAAAGGRSNLRHEPVAAEGSAANRRRSQFGDPFGAERLPSWSSSISCKRSRSRSTSPHSSLRPWAASRSSSSLRKTRATKGQKTSPMRIALPLSALTAKPDCDANLPICY